MSSLSSSLYTNTKNKECSCETQLLLLQKQHPILTQNQNIFIKHSETPFTNACSYFTSSCMTTTPLIHVNTTKPNYSHSIYSIKHHSHSNNNDNDMIHFTPHHNNTTTSMLSNINTHSNTVNTVNTSTLYKERILNHDDIRNIISSFDNHFLFKNMPRGIMELILLELIQVEFAKDKIVYKEGDKGSFFYIIAEGKLISYSTATTTSTADATVKEKKTYSQWECFGGLSLLTGNKREATVQTLTHVVLLCLSVNVYTKIKNKIAEEHYKDKFIFINNISFLKNLDAITKFKLTDGLTTCKFKPNECIFKEGETASSIYFVKDGLVSCRSKRKEIRKLQTQSCFGESGMLLNNKRALDVYALKHTTCYQISNDILNEVLGSNFINVILFSIFTVQIKQNPFFKDIIIDSLMMKLFNCFNVKYYSKHEVVYLKSELLHHNTHFTNDKVLLIIEGSLFFEGSELPFAGRGNVIGEDILFKDTIAFTHNIIANPDCVCLEANSDDIKTVLGIERSDVDGKRFNIYKRVNKLKKLYLFQHLSERTLSSIALHMKKVKYNEDDIIVEEGTVGSSLYLISKGKVTIKKGGTFIRYLESGSCFGEIALLSNSCETRSASVYASSTVVICYVLSKKEFDVILNENKGIKGNLLKKIALRDNSIQLNDLFFFKFLGKGKFGNVNLVHNKKNIYAVKSVSRLKVNKERILGKYLLNERKIMLMLDHPFIVKLIKTLKNKNFCFFLIEYINGINLDDYLNQKEKFKNVEECKFYIASLILVLEYLQKKNIIHRDLKPANIMIDSNGYLKLIDFGTAKELNDYTLTVVGTPHYISPEILIGKGYSLSCDFWSLGVCAYELFYGTYPFGNDASEVMEIYRDIVNVDYVLPSHKNKYCNVNELINVLLVKKVSKRMCEAKELKKLSLFNGFEWDKLVDFTLSPPYIPKQFDVSQVLKNTLMLFEKEIDREMNEMTEDCLSEDTVSNNKVSDKTWADEF